MTWVTSPKTAWQLMPRPVGLRENPFFLFYANCTWIEHLESCCFNYENENKAVFLISVIRVICLCFRFILLIESHGHSLLKVLEIKMHDLSVFEGLSDERNCGTQEIRWSKYQRKWKRDEGGGEDEGVINIELSCTEIFSAFALAATLWLMVSSLKNAVFKIKAKPYNAELFIFRWFCESILVKWHHINLYIINISHSLNISVTHRSCGSFICLICRNQDY